MDRLLVQITTHTILCLVSIAGPGASRLYAQEIYRSTQSGDQGCCNAELFLETDEGVGVYVDDVFRDSVIVSVDTVSTPCNVTKWNWVAQTQGETPACTAYTDISPSAFHKIEFRRSEGSYAIGYHDCLDSTPDTFFCDGGGASDSEYLIASSILYVGGSEVGVDSFQIQFSGGHWLFPHHGAAFCARRHAGNEGDLANCLEQFHGSIDNVGYFISNHTDSSSFSLTDADIVVPSGKDWRFNDVTLDFDEDTGIVVDGELLLEDAELTFAADLSDTLAGIRIADGGEVTFDDTPIVGGDIRMEQSTTSLLAFVGDSNYVAVDSILVSGTVDFDNVTVFDGTVMSIPVGDSVGLAAGDTLYLQGDISNP